MDEPKIHGKMFCRLCLVSTNDHQPLEGVLHGMLEAILLNTCLRATENPIICNNCVEKIHKAFEFKSTCVNTEVTLTHFVTPQENSKVDLKMVYWIEKNSCHKIDYDQDLKICRICVDEIRSNHYASLLDTVEVNKLEDMFKIYIPELTLTLTEDPLICEKCIENFRTFSAFISTSLDTETKIKSFCEDAENEDGSQVDLERIATPINRDNRDTNTDEDKKDTNILKLFKNENLLLDLYGESDIELDDQLNAAEENERKIMKLIKEEDVDLFYRDRPDFDVQDIDCEESECESYQDSFISFENPFPKLSYYWDLSTNQTLDFESPQPSSPEENSLSPEPSFKKCYDCKLNGSEKNGKCYSCEEKNSDSDDPKDDCCDCNKNIWCEKCKWKKEMAYDSSNSLCNTNSGKPASTKKVKKDGRKCRKVYGVEYKDMWCTQCRWKKACTRFVNRSVSRR